MTRRDFQLISATLRRARIGLEGWPLPVSPSDAADRHAFALADVLAGTNPKFDRARFLSASGVQS